MSDIINIKAKEFFNIDYVFPFQRLVISNTLQAAGFYSAEDKLEASPHQIVILPTGAGKSLCFMLPGVLLDGITLIIFPLLSLMADQERRILETGSTVVTLKGGMDVNELEKICNRIRGGEIKFILTNPETLQTVAVKKLLSTITIKHAVIDETHTVSQWGESFRPSYLEVGKILDEVGVELISAYTATASDYILKSITKYIFLNQPLNIVKGNPDRTNIHYNIIHCISKRESLIDLLGRVEEPCIIFHQSRVSAELINTFLIRRLHRDDIVYYHAGLNKEEKSSIEEWFFTSERGILNATCAYGMGVDKSNIRTVIHLQAPSSIEAYLQESGRAGRDRKQAYAYLLLYKHERDNIISRSLQEVKCRREVLMSLLGAETEYCSGCDICNETYNPEELGKKQILATLKVNKLRFNISELSSLLKGLYTFRNISLQLHNTKGFRLLEQWDIDHIREAIEVLSSQNIIHQIKFPLYRGKLK